MTRCGTSSLGATLESLRERSLVGRSRGVVREQPLAPMPRASASDDGVCTAGRGRPNRWATLPAAAAPVGKVYAQRCAVAPGRGLFCAVLGACDRERGDDHARAARSSANATSTCSLSTRFERIIVATRAIARHDRCVAHEARSATARVHRIERGECGVMRPCCHCSEQRAQVGHTRNGTVEHDLAATAASHARAAADWRVRGLSHSMTEARLDVARGVMRRVLVVGC